MKEFERVRTGTQAMTAITRLAILKKNCYKCGNLLMSNINSKQMLSLKMKWVRKGLSTLHIQFPLDGKTMLYSHIDCDDVNKQV